MTAATGHATTAAAGREPPSAQRLGSAVLLQGPAVADVAHLVEVGLRARQARDGIAPTTRQLAVLRELRGARDDLAPSRTASRPRHRDAADGSGLARLALCPDELSTHAAAALLGVGVRQVQRLAPRLGARRQPSGALLYDRAAVLSEAATRRAPTEPSRPTERTGE